MYWTKKEKLQTIFWLDENNLFQASFGTRISQWWSSIPFVTGIIVIICGVIYAICLLIGYDSFVEVCFLPGAVTAHYEGKFYYHDIEITHFALSVSKFMIVFSVQGIYSNTLPCFNSTCVVQHDGISAHW
jgi:hypothetical protein